MIRINLLAAERRPEKRGGGGAPRSPVAIQAYLILGLFAGGAIAACAGLYLWKTAVLNKLDADIAVAEERQRKLQAIQAEVKKLEAQRNTFKAQKELIERLKAEQGGPVHMLDEISRGLPDFVWLSDFDQTGANLRFRGQANSLASVADFITALMRARDPACEKPLPSDRTKCYFPSVDLGNTTEQAGLVTFELAATFNTPRPPADAAAAAAPAAVAKTP